ncbi:putative SERF-like protein [Convolutriloba macropyga]|uniref:putative SERF-like protein n=1 Tax=Convolutriloba macropyga TaxID=536237 RepID=UPI003F51FC53
MTRGNQRELAKAKNVKNNTAKSKQSANDGLTRDQIKERDAARMREKQQQAADKKSNKGDSSK